MLLGEEGEGQIEQELIATEEEEEGWIKKELITTEEEEEGWTKEELITAEEEEEEEGWIKEELITTEEKEEEGWIKDLLITTEEEGHDARLADPIHPFSAISLLPEECREGAGLHVRLKHRWSTVHVCSLAGKSRRRRRAASPIPVSGAAREGPRLRLAAPSLGSRQLPFFSSGPPQA